jgi:hypothetical protein
MGRVTALNNVEPALSNAAVAGLAASYSDDIPSRFCLALCLHEVDWQVVC